MEQTNYNFDKKRLETYIDAVIAIIVTILVLELKVPEGEHATGTTNHQLFHLLPSFLSYFASFLLIAALWIDHHILFQNVQKVTKRYIIMNMLFLFFLSIIPFTTAFAGHNYDDSFAVALLFVNYSLMNLSFGTLFWYADFKKILIPGYIRENKRTALYSSIGMLGLIAAIPIAYANTYVSFALGIIIFMGHLFKRP